LPRRETGPAITLDAKEITRMENTKARLSTFWIFAMFNYLYCDVLALMDSGYLKQVLTGNVAGIHMTQGFLLGASILMEIPTAMVLVSRVLGYRANRWANIIAGSIMTVVQVATLFMGASPTIYYIFFSIIEIACTALIVWYAWQWHEPEAEPQPVPGNVQRLQPRA
jgi:hypothetical protein